MVTKAVIMAGGKGTRLLSVTGDEIPKAMAVIAGKPIIEHQLDRLRENNITDISIVVCHLKEKIMDYLGDGSRFGMKIDYVIGHDTLGTAGALYFYKSKDTKPTNTDPDYSQILKQRFRGITGDFLLLFADIIFDIDIKRMHEFHTKNKSVATLYTHPNSHPYDSDLVITDSDSRITKILKAKEGKPEFYRNIVNAGFFMLNAKALESMTELKKLNMERDFVGGLVIAGERVFAYNQTEYLKDVGTPDRIRSVGEDIINGVVSARNLSRPQRAIFLDRDGTINTHIPWLAKAEQFELLPGAAEAIKLINKSGFLAVVITNQPIIARGDCTFEELQRTHDKMETLLGADGAYVDGIFFCPHHPLKGFPNDVVELKIECDCRKPRPGMLHQAANKFNIDLGASWMIGDSASDVEAGRAAGTKTILLAGEIDLLAAVKKILEGK